MSRSLCLQRGNGNGSFGLGWSLSIPCVIRKTSKGIPRYRDGDREMKDLNAFVLSGVEDLVPVEDPTLDPVKATRYRPRTEGFFARSSITTIPKLESGIGQCAAKLG